ncbi:MAG TPA: ABC transporter ATP-binding protein [Symbiobacteriaceae bacterium]|nr:ABC transporter ATP-binding protein [Symbiobacteriaceae bacterium]
MAISVQHVSKSFNGRGKAQSGTLALQDVSLDIADGEFVTFLGPSGCGKSTLLNLIAGLGKADAGTLLVDGQPVTGASQDRLMIFQEPALFPWLTVLENVEFGLNLQKRSKAEVRERALHCLQTVHLGNASNSFPHELSGGMRQRAAIARALAMDPKMLLMDEPFAALDEQTRLVLQNEVVSLWQGTGKTVLFVTHNIREAIFLADRILVFGTRPGRIKAEFRVNSPRPRQVGNPYLAELEAEIMAVLRDEIEKVARAEIDKHYQLKLALISNDPLQQMGADI